MLKLLISFEEKNQKIFFNFLQKFSTSKKLIRKKNHKKNIMGFYELGDFG